MPGIHYPDVLPHKFLHVLNSQNIKLLVKKNEKRFLKKSPHIPNFNETINAFYDWLIVEDYLQLTDTSNSTITQFRSLL